MLLVANIFTISGSIFYIFSEYFEFVVVELSLGLGCFLTWFSLMKYLQNAKEYTVLIRTFEVALPLLIKIGIGAMPIFFGFVFFGMCVFFSFEEKYGMFSRASFCLFAIMNGDSILDNFAGTTPTHFIIGQIFTYCWTFLGIVVI